jgi:hypothetical protein
MEPLKPVSIDDLRRAAARLHWLGRRPGTERTGTERAIWIAAMHNRDGRGQSIDLGASIARRVEELTTTEIDDDNTEPNLD